MIKNDELANPTSCLNRAQPDEPVFVLRAKDVCAAQAIRYWCSLRVDFGKNVSLDDQITEALGLAKQMDDWRARQARERLGVK